jgi:hypothetical protein
MSVDEGPLVLTATYQQQQPVVPRFGVRVYSFCIVSATQLI